ncbi:dihydrodipicolinate synthase family protein [Oceanispirochaeta crateris]|uniref:Dihydrodipicolinate synthase family protein n=1 Tax=Oceanispirochaeta crateris TaxID=2518645 RepID=A0A5C1QPR6_9SPIO|nr:dihydrodipicolinate synthase family protein [Oceanispirochaeta crateris]QEN09467.1 dihydrodipicolinate synthase family protein [Oceanispirochaeta crateris]
MNPIKDLLGIITVLNTPFTSEDKLDVLSLVRNVRYALDAGVKGFLVPAMASEVGVLSESEKLEMVRTVVDACEGRVPVIGGTSAPSLKAMCRLAESNLKLGCQGILANIPYENNDQYRANVSELDRLGPEFLMLQDWDSSGYGLPSDHRSSSARISDLLYLIPGE